MARIAYTVALHLLLPIIFFRMWWRGRTLPAYRERWLERLSFHPQQLPHCLWVHTVSVGEFLAAVPYLKALLERYPEQNLLITTMTPTGSAQVSKQFGDHPRVRHVYLPYDLSWAMARTIKRFRPKALVILETELWPNLIAACARHRVPVMVANARLSERSANGYNRVKALVRPMLSRITRILVQAQPDADRFMQLGARPEQVRVMGSVKFDLSVSESVLEEGRAIREHWGAERPVWIAASTHPGEEEQMLLAHAQVLQRIPEALLVLVPRHPERAGQVAQLLDSYQLGYVTRSGGVAPAANQQVLLGDTLGEMLKLFAASDLAFVGGSLVPHGGHNVLEPLAIGRPACTGPHFFNFQTICDELLEAGGLGLVSSPEQLAQWLCQRLVAPESCAPQLHQAATVLERNRGALERLLDETDRLIASP